MVLNCFVGIKTESVHAREEILKVEIVHLLDNRVLFLHRCARDPVLYHLCEFERLCLATTVDGHTITPLIVGTMQGGLVYFYFLSVD